MRRRALKVSLALLVAVLFLMGMVSSSVAQSSLTPQKSFAVSQADTYASLVEKVAKTVWGFAEIGLGEYKSAAFLEGELEKLGYAVDRGIAQFPTAFVGTWSYGTGGPVIGLLAEYDALPSLSPDVPGAPGHGCGHNLYSAGAIATAAVLKNVMSTYQLPGTIKVFGTPAEENFDGKAWMGRQGALKGVDVFFGTHAAGENSVPFGSNLAMDFKVYTFYGKSSHAGAAPEKGISALDAQEIMDVAVNFLREHLWQEIRIHYIINKGGEAPNVVPSLAQSQWFIRAPERGMVNETTAKVDRCAEAAALATGCTYHIELVSALHNKIPNKAGALLAYENLKLIGVPTFTEKDQADAKSLGFPTGLSTELKPAPDKPSQSYGSSDEGDVSWNAPFINFSMANYAQGTAGHSVELAKQANLPAAFKAVVQAVKVMSATAVDLLMKPDELKKIKDEFAETMKTRNYDPGSQVMLGLKYFPEPPGVTAATPDSVTFVPADMATTGWVAGTIVNVYNGTEKIGTATVTGNEKELKVKTTKSFKSGDILTIKYQNKNGPEILYGYVKKF